MRLPAFPRRIMPNTDYLNLRKNKLLQRITSFYFTVVEKKYTPYKIFWEMNMTNTSGTISLTAYNTHRVYSHHADTVDNIRRDFRMKRAAGNSSQDNPVKWIRTDIKKVKRNFYKKEMTFPGKGWRGFLVEVTFPKK
uniref:Uncharacterized protein n=1 Tax=Sphaerodactylus townsendi TaxID=933632 RepID=A0ACB8FG14_9SAUR